MSEAAIQPDRILEQLEELWSGLGGEQDAEVLRACAMTLLVVTEGPGGDAALAEVLAAVVQEHPSRVIVAALSEGPARRLTASVSARCWLPFGRRQQICCEQIEISATRGALADLAPVALALAAPDLPVVIWVRAWRRLGEEPLRPVLRLADKLIVDSAGAASAEEGLKRVQSAAGIAGLRADLAWTRLTPWRAALAEAFGQPPCSLEAAAVERIEIGFEGGRVPPEALYLRAWLESVVEKASIRLAPAPERSGGGLYGLALEGQGVAVSLSWAAGELQLAIGGRPVRRLGPAPSEGELLAEELSLLERDPVFEAVLERALARLGGR